MSDIIIRGEDGRTYRYAPTTEGYRQAEAKMAELNANKAKGLSGLADSRDNERVYDYTQPHHREVGIFKKRRGGW